MLRVNFPALLHLQNAPHPCLEIAWPTRAKGKKKNALGDISLYLIVIRTYCKIIFSELRKRKKCYFIHKTWIQFYPFYHKRARMLRLIKKVCIICCWECRNLLVSFSIRAAGHGKILLLNGDLVLPIINATIYSIYILSRCNWNA